jgi:phosphoenolpyruvate synthase/pyruvate phosphate dikinase
MCANLGEMTKLGLLVPHGFSLSLDGYELFVSGCVEGTRKITTGHIASHTPLPDSGVLFLR